MSDEFGQLLSEQKEVAISQGAVVSGQVIAVKEDEIVLNIGYKADAVISRNEFTNIPNANLCDLVKVGDEIEAKVVKMNDGEARFSFLYASCRQREEARFLRTHSRTRLY